MFFQSPDDISQTNINRKLARYLNIEGRDPELIEKLKIGYCHGFAILAVYSLWLQFQPEKLDGSENPIPRDDWSWVEGTLKLLAQWDERSVFSHDERVAIDRLLSLIEYFQWIPQYLPIRQGELQHSLEDTHIIEEAVINERGDVIKPKKRRQFTKEYSLAGMFTIKDMMRILPSIIHEDRLILVASHKHGISILKNGDFYYFYNSNNKKGFQAITTENIAQLATTLFASMKYDQDIPSPFGFTIFDCTDNKKEFSYLAQKELLKSSPLVSGRPGYANNETAITIASNIGCEESMKYFLSGDVPSTILKAANTQALQAVQNGHIEVLRLFAQKGLDLNQPTIVGGTLLFMASQKGYGDIVNFLIENGANVHARSQANIRVLDQFATHDGKLNEWKDIKDRHFSGRTVNMLNDFTALHIAVFCGHKEIVKRLLAAGANAHDETEGISALELANALGYPEIDQELNASVRRSWSK